MLQDPIKVYDARWQVSEFDDTAVRRLFESTFLYGQELGVQQVTLCRDARHGAARLLEVAVRCRYEYGPYGLAVPRSGEHSAQLFYDTDGFGTQPQDPRAYDHGIAQPQGVHWR